MRQKNSRIITCGLFGDVHSTTLARRGRETSKIGHAVATWREEAARLGFTKTGIDRMASASEHDDLGAALAGHGWLGPEQQALLASSADLLHNALPAKLLIMVFFMVSIHMTTRKPAPLLAFRGLFTIEWE